MERTEEEQTMQESHRDPEVIETTLWQLVTTIDEVTDSDDESFAVLESMLAEGRVRVLSTARACAA